MISLFGDEVKYIHLYILVCFVNTMDESIKTIMSTCTVSTNRAISTDRIINNTRTIMIAVTLGCLIRAGMGFQLVASMILRSGQPIGE
jgi:hypothetical protein